MYKFRGAVRSEGSTGNLRIAVPSELKVPAPAWYAAEITGVHLLVFVRSPPSRPWPTFTLPSWAFPDLVAGTEIDVELATPQRATGQLPGFDWLPFVPERCFPTQDGDDLLLHSRYEPPFRLRRAPLDLRQHYRLLGYYQAEGSKADTGADWSFATAASALGGAALAMLAAWGVPSSRCHSEILHAPEEVPGDAVAFFTSLGLEVSAVRPRTGRGGHAVVIHVRSSVFLRDMTLGALHEIFEKGFPSREAALDYALGWLDGDGSVTIEHSVRLALAGLEEEHLVVQEAFRTAFGWQRRGRGWLDNKQGTHVRLQLGEVAQLLEAGAFPYSMNRVKLLLALDERTRRLRDFTQAAPSRLNGAHKYVQLGLLEKAPVRGYRLSAAGEGVLAACERLRPEIERVRASAPPRGITGRKGVAYPGLT